MGGISAGIHILEQEAWMFSNGVTFTVSNNLRDSPVGSLAVKSLSKLVVCHSGLLGRLLRLGEKRKNRESLHSSTLPALELRKRNWIFVFFYFYKEPRSFSMQ